MVAPKISGDPEIQVWVGTGD